MGLCLGNAANCFQGFRKYLSHARDHEELLAFLLGQLVKDKVRSHQLLTGEQPSKVVVKTDELDERVRRLSSLCLY